MKRQHAATWMLAGLMALSACTDDGDTTADEENESIDQGTELEVEEEAGEGTNENAVAD